MAMYQSGGEDGDSGAAWHGDDGLDFRLVLYTLLL